MSKKAEPMLVMTTCRGSITAKQIAQDLVANRLAACVNTLSVIHSCFRWGGKVDHAEEILLLIKTTSDCYPKVEEKIKSFHPYELPEIIAVPISAGLDGYLDWIDESTN